MAIPGRTPTAVSQPPGFGLNYPFLAPSSDVQKLFSDFYLSYLDDNGAFALPLRIAWLHGFGTTVVSPPGGFPAPTHTYDLIVKDANNQTVFDSTQASQFVTLAWGSTRQIVEWQTAEQVCRVVFYTGWPGTQTPLTYTTYITPANGALDPRTYERLPHRLRSVTVAETTLPAGRLQLVEGFNCALSAAPLTNKEGGRFGSAVTISLAPGGGQGQAPGCGDTTRFITNINGQTPNASGSFILDGKDCFRTQIPVAITTPGGQRLATPTPNALDIEENCQPCCLNCTYLINTYLGLKNVWDFWLSIAQKAEQVRDTYKDNITRWNQQAACRQANPARLVALPEPGCSVQIAATYANMTMCCLNRVTFVFTLQIVGGGPLTGTALKAYVSGSSTNGIVPYAMLGGNPIFTAILAPVAPQSMSMNQWRVCLTGCSPSQSLLVTMTVHAPNPSPTVDGQPCTLPTVSVPSSIQAIWTANSFTPTDPARAIMTQQVALNNNPRAYPNC